LSCWPAAAVCFCTAQELLLSRISPASSSKDFQDTSDSLLPATKGSTKPHLVEQGVSLTPSCQRSMLGTGRMQGATPTTTQTSGRRLLRPHLRLYSVQLQTSNLKQPVKNNQTLLKPSAANSTELSKPPLKQPSMQQLLDSQQLLSVVFQPLFHSGGSSQPRQVQASWHYHFFRGKDSHLSNSLTTVNLPPLPLLLEDFNQQLQQRQEDQPQLPGKWMWMQSMQRFSKLTGWPTWSTSDASWSCWRSRRK